MFVIHEIRMYVAVEVFVQARIAAEDTKACSRRLEAVRVVDDIDSTCSPALT